jgi:hypothetical protein
LRMKLIGKQIVSAFIRMLSLLFTGRILLTASLCESGYFILRHI